MIAHAIHGTLVGMAKHKTDPTPKQRPRKPVTCPDCGKVIGLRYYDTHRRKAHP